MKGIATAPVAATLLAQQAATPPATTGPANPAPGVPLNPTQPVEPPARANAELPKIDIAIPDATSQPTPHYFTKDQFATLTKLCEVLMPPAGKAPGAVEAGAPEFLDFLISASPADRQSLYKNGLDNLQAQANKRFKKPFAELDADQVDALLAPLRQPWTYELPADPIIRFLHAAKQDVRTATVNSREYSAVAAATSRRGAGGGIYWYPLD